MGNVWLITWRSFAIQFLTEQCTYILVALSTMTPLYSGHPWDVANWLLYKGGLIIQCTFNREVLVGTLLGGEVTFLYTQVCDMAALDRFHCTYAKNYYYYVCQLERHLTRDVLHRN